MNKWTTGSGAPLRDHGDTGEYYLDTDNGRFYEKTEPRLWRARGILRGEKGDRGSRGDAGAVGRTGAEGRLGPQGVNGSSGMDGKRGEIGEQGWPGIDGGRGPQGRQGTPGTNGIDGLDGKWGADGVPGVKGERGDQGADGKDTEIEMLYVECGESITLGSEWKRVADYETVVQHSIYGLDHGIVGLPMGLYEITADFSMRVALGASRSEAAMRVTAGRTVQERHVYLRQEDYEADGSASFVVQIAAGDTVAMFVKQTKGDSRCELTRASLKIKRVN